MLAIYLRRHVTYGNIITHEESVNYYATARRKDMVLFRIGNEYHLFFHINEIYEALDDSDHSFRGCVRSPFLRRRAPFRALKRLIGLRERAVGQASGGF